MTGIDRSTQSDRIVTLDILRGMALFGMIIVHFHQRMEKPSSGTEDFIGWFVWMFLETKAWATFALLFGAGFAIFIRRAEARGLNVVPLYLRRMAMLAVFGILVQVLFGFRILIDYAMWGVVLLFIRKLPTRALIVVAVVAAVAPSITSRVWPMTREAVVGQFTAIHDAEEKGTFSETAAQRAEFARWYYVRPQILSPDSNLVLFIVGLLAIRHGVFEDPKKRKRAIVIMMTFGFAAWAVVWTMYFRNPDESFSGFGILSDQWLAFTYVGGITLALAYRPRWMSRLSSFSITGRMALTNYVVQAAILSVLASGYGFALKIRPYYVIPASVILFAVCVALSAAWLARARYGPLERVWRWFTYAEWRSMPVPGAATS